MKSIALGMVALFMSTSLFAQKLTNDPAHSKLGFSVEHLTISHIEGNFADFNTELSFTKDDLSDAKFVVSGKIASITTGVDARDNHLKSADFFDAEKYPTLDFVSTSFKKVKGKDYELKGNLTLHGVTKAVTLKATYNGSVVNPMSNQKTYGFTISGTINRNDFGVGSKFPEAVVGNTVTIDSNLEFPVK